MVIVDTRRFDVNKRLFVVEIRRRSFRRRSDVDWPDVVVVVAEGAFDADACRCPVHYQTRLLYPLLSELKIVSLKVSFSRLFSSFFQGWIVLQSLEIVKAMCVQMRQPVTSKFFTNQDIVGECKRKGSISRKEFRFLHFLWLDLFGYVAVVVVVVWCVATRALRDTI